MKSDGHTGDMEPWGVGEVGGGVLSIMDYKEMLFFRLEVYRRVRKTPRGGLPYKNDGVLVGNFVKNP